jgi:hypothetical protein
MKEVFSSNLKKERKHKENAVGKCGIRALAKSNS